MGVICDDCAALPYWNANTGGAREACETSARKNAARICCLGTVTIRFYAAAKLKRDAFKVERLQSKHRKGVLLCRRRESFFTGGGEIAMHSPKTKASRESTSFSLIEKSLVEKTVVLELSADLACLRFDLGVFVVVVLERERARVDERSRVAKATAK